MATFKKGQSFKGNRVHVVAVFDQKGPGMTGKNVAFSLSNDLAQSHEEVFTNPMLVYDKYKDKDGNVKNTYTASYSAEQWKKIEATANKDGDAMVLEADLFPDSRGKGLLVNTNTLKTPEIPFNAEKHRENTLAAREAKKQMYKERQQQATAEKEPEPELQG